MAVVHHQLDIGGLGRAELTACVLGCEQDPGQDLGLDDARGGDLVAGVQVVLAARAVVMDRCGEPGAGVGGRDPVDERRVEQLAATTG